MRARNNGNHTGVRQAEARVHHSPIATRNKLPCHHPSNNPSVMSNEQPNRIIASKIPAQAAACARQDSSSEYDAPAVNPIGTKPRPAAVSPNTKAQQKRQPQRDTIYYEKTSNEYGDSEARQMFALSEMHLRDDKTRETFNACKKNILSGDLKAIIANLGDCKDLVHGITDMPKPDEKEDFFEKITFFQYALIVSDYPLWQLLRNCLADEQAKVQLMVLEKRANSLGENNYDYIESYQLALQVFLNMCEQNDGNSTMLESFFHKTCSELSYVQRHSPIGLRMAIFARSIIPLDEVSHNEFCEQL
ncbi:MAG: hypothetical protein KDH94_08010, partial [Coxiellaceae bacterium]|nr:hypothetical protein [Coxiellaceae bacterium]